MEPLGGCLSYYHVMSSTTSFPTKAGYAEAAGGRLTLYDLRTYGPMRALVGTSVVRKLFLLGLGAFLLALIALEDLYAGGGGIYLLCLLGILYFVWQAEHTRHFSDVKEIPVSAIAWVRIYPDLDGCTRPYVVVCYEDEASGELAKRLITLPGVGEGPDNAKQQAADAIQRLGLPLDDYSRGVAALDYAC